MNFLNFVNFFAKSIFLYFFIFLVQFLSISKVSTKENLKNRQARSCANASKKISHLKKKEKTHTFQIVEDLLNKFLCLNASTFKNRSRLNSLKDKLINYSEKIINFYKKRS